MGEYLSFVIGAAAVVALGGLLAHGGVTEKSTRAALGVILLATVATPLVGGIRELGELTLDGVLGDYSVEIDEEDSACYETAEEAFCEGIRSEVCAEFSLEADEVTVLVFGFELTEMRAEKIKIILSGRAACADSRSIAAHVRGAGLGDCEVELELS